MPRIESNPTPAVLVFARKSAALPIDLAAKKLGVRTELLRAWEDGEQHPTFAQLRELETIYNINVPELYLFLPPGGSDHRIVTPPLARKTTQQSPLRTSEVESLSRDKKLAELVEKKLNNPSLHQVMKTAEAAYALGKSRSTIHRYLNEGKLTRSNMPGSILTKSVLHLLSEE
jgi:transcriptional regulator with XRE-family HTH domain